jgi:hypothetical protein
MRESFDPICVLSAEQSGRRALDNRQRSRSLRQDLAALGLSVTPAVGWWEGTRETSYVVAVPTPRLQRAVLALAFTAYGQRAVLYADRERRASLVDVQGKRRRLGRLVGSERQPDADAYTYVPSLRMYFHAEPEVDPMPRPSFEVREEMRHA